MFEKNVLFDFGFCYFRQDFDNILIVLTLLIKIER